MKVFRGFRGNFRSFVNNKHHGRHHGQHCRINGGGNTMEGCFRRNDQCMYRGNSPEFRGMEFPQDLSKTDWMKHHHGPRHHWRPHHHGPHHHMQCSHENHGPHKFHGHHHHHGTHKHPHHHHGPHHGHGHYLHRPHQHQQQNCRLEGIGSHNICPN